ncbi:MAG: Nif3-like dinuclear metal center hexameric protein [Eggerthellales bacterium]|nr:Nif3-like dinuclear metal center hexameric protein [Eggerthellales bacterium]
MEETRDFAVADSTTDAAVAGSAADVATSDSATNAAAGLAANATAGLAADSKVNPGSGQDRIFTVGELEEALLTLLPASHAESWDRTGVLVGDRDQEVTGVLVALDPTVAAIRAAVNLGCNVVLTHHPAFLDPPAFFGPLAPENPEAGSVVYEAVAAGVALMNFHTALDVSPRAQQVLPGALDLSLQGILEVTGTEPLRGYGQISQAPEGMTLGDLAKRAASALGGNPRVWGDPAMVAGRVVTATGASSDLTDLCLQAGVDCLVAGEVKYHAALSAANRGLGIIELGHDISELPLCEVLLSCLADLGFPQSLTHHFSQHSNWR